MTRPSARLAASLLAALGGLASLPACASDDAESLGVETYVLNAQGYMDGGHYDQALTQFRRALELDPYSSKALLGEANCLYYLGMGDTPAAGRSVLEAAEKADLLDPDAYGENAWKVHLTRGMVHARLADLWDLKAALAEKNVKAGEPGAAAALEEARRNSAENAAVAEVGFRAVLATEEEPMARNNLTALFFLATRSAIRARSAEDYTEALELFRRYEKEIENSKGLWARMKKEEPDLAEVYDRKLKGAERQEIQLRDLVANICFKRGNFEASIGELDKIIALDPYRAEAFLNRGRNHEELGRFGAAADDYRRFLKLTDLKPGSPLVVEAADRMAKCEERARESTGP